MSTLSTWPRIAIVLTVFAAAAFFSVAVSTDITPTTVAATQQQSYPMTCRGGGLLSIANDGRKGVRIRFQTSQGAVTAGLASGQCTWSDRALNSAEPTTICDDGANAAQYVGALVQSDEHVILQVYNDGHGCMRVTRVGP